MKRRLFLSILAAIITALVGYSQEIKDIEVTDLTLEIRDGYLNVDMDLDLSKLSVKGTQVVVLSPYIINGRDSLVLKSVGVYGRNRKVYYQRNEDVKPTGNNDDNFSPSEIKDLVKYKTRVPFSDWMDGCRVEVMRVDYGCCGESDLISQSTLVEKFPLDPYIPELVYVKPSSEVVKMRELSGSAYIDFPVSQTEIYPDYRNNQLELDKIISTIDSVKNDRDVTILSLSIKGYASPESPYSNNAHLAKGRTASLKDYVQSLYHFDEGLIQTSYEPEDWAGLEKYVMNSSLPHKQEILEVIRSDHDPDNKEWIIKSTWKEDYKYLLDNCYPALRHSDYKIEYSIRSFSEPAEIEAVFRQTPHKLSLAEFYLLAQTYESGSEEFDDLFETAVRMYPEDPVANLNAANSAIVRKDYKRALRYLEKAEGLPEAVYARGILELYMENKDAAISYLKQAAELGIPQAEVTIRESSKNRMIYRMKTNNN